MAANGELAAAFRRQSEGVLCVICKKRVPRRTHAQHLDSCSVDPNDPECRIVEDGETWTPAISVTTSELKNSYPGGAIKRKIYQEDKMTVKNDCWKEYSKREKIDRALTDSGSKSSELTILGSTELIKDEENGEENTPYQCKFFTKIVEEIGSEESFAHLWTEKDKEILQKFFVLKDAEKQAFIKLFLRKFVWIPVSRLNPDLLLSLDYLVSTQFIFSDENLTDLTVILNEMQLEELRDLAKQFKVPNPLTSKKSVLCSTLKSLSSKQKSVFGNSIEQNLVKKAKNILGRCVKVSDEHRNLFLSIFYLYAPDQMCTSNLLDKPSMNLPQQILFTMLRVDKKDLNFPVKAGCSKRCSIYTSRDQLNSYRECCEMEGDIAKAISKGDHETVSNYGLIAMEANQSLEKSEVSHLKSLPQFLRWYTAPWVRTRIVWESVESLQKLKRYTEAVGRLLWLLNENQGVLWCPDYRGRWWDRLALNYDSHLKSPVEAVKSIVRAMEDSAIRPQHKYALLERGERIKSSKRSQKAKKAKIEEEKEEVEKSSAFEALNAWLPFGLREWKTITITGKLLKKNLGDGVKTVFVQGCSESFKVYNVEAVALDHYFTAEKFDQGLHGEGSTWHTLLGLLFWDQIYTNNVENVWWSDLQSHPLDMNDPEFFSRRAKGMKKRLKWLKVAKVDEIEAVLARSWTENFEKTVGLVSWDMFEGLQQLQDFAKCVGGKRMALTAEYLFQDFRHRRSGFPDLTVWNVNDLRIKVVEVKGPGDRLSPKQRIWLDFFLSIGIDGEVCLVNGDTL